MQHSDLDELVGEVNLDVADPKLRKSVGFSLLKISEKDFSAANDEEDKEKTKSRTNFKLTWTG